MNHCVVQQNAFAACDEIRGPVAVPDRKDSVVCPRPRRLGVLPADHHARPLRWHLPHQPDGNDLLDILLSKGGGGGGGYPAAAAASSPPFFCGSPPSRAANPLIRDARFAEAGAASAATPAATGNSPSGVRGKGCVRAKFGHTPAPVRVEGFDCLDGNHRGCRIPALA